MIYESIENTLPFAKIAESYYDLEEYALSFFKDNKLTIIEAEKTLDILKANLPYQLCSGNRNKL